MCVIVINWSEVYSGVKEPRPEGGSLRVKVLITRASTESTVYNYYSPQLVQAHAQ